MFQAMLERVKYDAASLLAKVEIRSQEEVDREEAEQRERLMRALQPQHAQAPSLLGTASVDQALAAAQASLAAAPQLPPSPADDQNAATFIRGERKVGRNEPCPCGSGKKFKQCHGALDA